MAVAIRRLGAALGFAIASTALSAGPAEAICPPPCVLPLMCCCVSPCPTLDSPTITNVAQLLDYYPQFQEVLGLARAARDGDVATLSAFTAEQLREAGLANLQLEMRNAIAGTPIHALYQVGGGTALDPETTQPGTALDVSELSTGQRVHNDVLELEAAADGISRTSGPDAPEDEVIESFNRAIVIPESNGDPTAQNPYSSAGGVGQFTDATWVTMLERERPDLAASMTRDEMIRMKTDASAIGVQQEMLGALSRDNARVLRSHGVPVSHATLGMAHRFGAGTAGKMLQMDPGMRLEDALVASAGETHAALIFEQNPDLRRDQPVGSATEFYGALEGEGGGAYAGGLRARQNQDETMAALSDINDDMAATVAASTSGNGLLRREALRNEFAQAMFAMPGEGPLETAVTEGLRRVRGQNLEATATTNLSRARIERQRLEEMGDELERLTEAVSASRTLRDDLRVRSDIQLALMQAVAETTDLFSHLAEGDVATAVAAVAPYTAQPPRQRDVAEMVAEDHRAALGRAREHEAVQALAHCEDSVREAQGFHEAAVTLKSMQANRAGLEETVAVHELHKQHAWQLREDLRRVMRQLYVDGDAAFERLVAEMQAADRHHTYASSGRYASGRALAESLVSQIIVQRPTTAFGERRPNPRCIDWRPRFEDDVCAPKFVALGDVPDTGVRAADAAYGGSFDAYRRGGYHIASRLPRPDCGPDEATCDHPESWHRLFVLLQYQLEAERRRHWWNMMRRGLPAVSGVAADAEARVRMQASGLDPRLEQDLLAATPSCLVGPVPTATDHDRRMRFAEMPDFFDLDPACPQRRWQAGEFAGEWIEPTAMGGVDASLWLTELNLIDFVRTHRIDLPEAAWHGERPDVAAVFDANVARGAANLAAAEAACDAAAARRREVAGDARSDARLAELFAVIEALRADPEHESIPDLGR